MEIGKRKYVYRVYEANGFVHSQRYPIIYSNSEVTYLKISRGSYLKKVYTKSIKEAFVNIEDINFKRHEKIIETYFYECEKENFIKVKNIVYKKLKLTSLKQDLEKAKIDKQRKNDEIIRLENEIEVLTNGSNN